MLQALKDLSRDELLARAQIRARDDAGYIPTECLVYFVRTSRADNSDAWFERLYKILSARVLRALPTADAADGASRSLTRERIKHQAHCIDFGDLVSMPVQLLESDPGVRASIQGAYDHVLVDEYQDVNRSSVRLLEAICPTGENLWVVGDAKQSIYRFRGASSFNTARFGKEDFPDGARGRLKRNYRSSKEVVDAFSAFATQMKVSNGDTGLDADRGALGAPVELHAVRQGDEQVVAIADAIEAMRAGGYKYRDQAVLCTGNERLSSIGRDLERLGIPVLFLGSLFERPEVKDLLAILSLLVDARAMGVVRVGALPQFALSLADVAVVLGALRDSEEDGVPGGWSKIDPAMLSEPGRAAWARLQAVLAGFSETSSPWDVLTAVLLERTRIAADIATATSVSDRSRGIAIWQFMNYLRVQPSGRGWPVRRLLDRVRRLVRIGDDRDLRQLPAAAQSLDAVRLMTVHGAKGLEFPVVHLPGLNQDTLPGNAKSPACLPPDGMIAGGEGDALTVFRAGDAEERECLFYVAASRARDRLFLYAVMRKGIVPYSVAIDTTNAHLLDGVTFAFICIDDGPSKKAVVQKLEAIGASFIDVGMGLQIDDGSLGGILRMTASTPAKREHIHAGRIDFSDEKGADLYATNIQVADLNALNAVLAVIKWKKLRGFYRDLEGEHHCTYTTDGNLLLNGDQ